MNTRPVGIWSQICTILLLGAGVATTQARTSNGNEFALYYSEAKTPAERTSLFEEAKDRPHFFRYLQIMEMGTAKDGGVTITAFEPSSLMDVHFVITKSVSLALLKQDPVSKIGRALADTGKLVSVDEKKNTIYLEGSIVRHKDRLAPKMGKEMLYEVDPGAVFYNYTGGSRPVTLTYKDRDLIRHKEKIIEKGGADAWVKFLEAEVAKRQKARTGSGDAKSEGGS